MGFSKSIAIGSAGSLVISESQGKASLEVNVGESLGGGQAEGSVKASANVKVEIEAAELAQLGLDLIKSKLPESMQGLVSALESVAIPAIKNS